MLRMAKLAGKAAFRSMLHRRTFFTSEPFSDKTFAARHFRITFYIC